MLIMWYSEFLKYYDVDYNNISEENFLEIRENMSRIQSPAPEVSLVVIAYNEQRHLAACLASLSKMKTKFPMEVIVVDNNSSDATAELIHKCGAIYTKQEKPGHGNARNKGLEVAKGKYYMCMDSDTLYPPTYVDNVVTVLEREGVAAVNTYYGFIDKNYSRFELAIYEFVKNLNSRILQIKRPESVARGAVLSYNREVLPGLSFRTDIKRGSDGSLVYALKKHGKIVFLRNRKVRAITSFRSMAGKSSIFAVIFSRVSSSLIRLKYYFTTKTAKECIDTEDNKVK